MVKLQYKELFIYDHINSRELSDNYISKPRKNGQLFILIKIPKNRNNTQSDIDNIIKKCSECFESIKQNDAELLLEEILQELNLFLPEKYKRKKNLFINNLDMIIGIIENNTIHLSNTGNVYALLIHNNKLTPLLSKNIEKLESSKIFEDIISGELNNNDILIASTNSLFDYISQEKIKKITKQNNPYNSVSKIKKILETVPDFVIFNSLIIKKINNSNEKIYTDEINKLLIEDKTVVVILMNSDAHSIMVQRKFIIDMMNRGVRVPVIINRTYNTSANLDFQLKSSIDIGSLLIDGLGDGVWLEFGSDKGLVNQTVFGILQASRMRISKTEYISCPSCGRTLFDLQDTTSKIREVTNHLKGLKIGIMGCIVNGPGEMADADYGYVGTGSGFISLYKGQDLVKRNIPTDRAVDALIDLIKEHGDWTDSVPV